MNFYGLKSRVEVICVSYFCLLPFISNSGKSSTVSLQKTGFNSTVVDHFQVG